MIQFDSRHLYPKFHFHQYQWHFENKTKLIIRFEFEIEKLCKFDPKVEINFPDTFTNNLLPEEMGHLVFQYGLAELVSYWKATCSPKIHIHCGNLNTDQIRFWKNLYYLGLGEFRFQNQIVTSEDDFVSFVCTPNDSVFTVQNKSSKAPEKFLIPIGGGKDSIVTLEILRKNNMAPFLFFLNPRASQLRIGEISGVPKERWIIVNRQINTALLDLNQRGFLNGHTPFSAMLAFLTTLIAVPMGLSHIVLSNESSANEGNVLYQGAMINHQYSKTFDFEHKFAAYLEKYVTNQTKYFSFLRPLKELQIAKLFAKYGQYHACFRSCNVGQKKDEWCGSCSKCLFVWVILNPWLPLSEMIKIFGKNLWNDKELLGLLKQISGIAGIKPFECVGTLSEVRAALSMSIKKFEKENFPLLIEAQHWKWDILPENNHSPEHAVPPSFWKLLQNELVS